MKTRSFRAKLAVRFTLAMTMVASVVTTVGYLALRAVLDRQIDGSLLSVASIQAASVTDDPDGEMHFHEWDLTPSEAASLKDLNRYAQIWSESGESLLRSRYMTTDLPVDLDLLGAASSGPVWREDFYQGQPIRALYYPLGRLGPSHTSHVLEVAAPLVARDRTLQLVRYVLVGVVVVVGLGSFAGSWWLGVRTVRPVTEIIDQTEEIGAATLGRRIDANADVREYERLVGVLNTMLDRIDAAFEAQRRFTADASHELRSPLTALRGELELALRRDRSPGEYRRTLESALEEAERLGRLADDLLTLARSDAGVIQPRLVSVRLDRTVRDVVARQEEQARQEGVTIVVAGASGLHVTGDPALLDRLVTNLIRNAVRFAPHGSAVDVAVGLTASSATLSVSDRGPGIPKPDLERVFERFYRAPDSDTSEGAGLGLSIARAIAAAHGGTVAAANRPEGGAVFTVRLPHATLAPTPEAAALPTQGLGPILKIP